MRWSSGGDSHRNANDGRDKRILFLRFPLAGLDRTARNGRIGSLPPTRTLSRKGYSAVSTETNGLKDTSPVPTSHPKGFWYIFSGELAERASFYGMKSILLLYLVHVFGYKENNASSLVHLYVAACYFTPLIGGFLADRFLGKYWTIVFFAVPYTIGQFVVGLSNEYLMFGALALLALGSGIIKPNISTLMGLTYDQQRPGQEQLRSQAFAWFYVSINIGSALSTLICPWLRNTFGKFDPETKTLADPQTGYMVAFMFPAVLMAIAFCFFTAGKRHYAVETPGKPDTSPSPTNEPAEASKWKVVGQVGGLFFLVMFFWAIFDQHTSTWILFAKNNLELNVGGYEVPPDQIQALNPIFIVCFVPLVNLFFSRLAKRGIRVRPTDKMIAGFLLTAFCMAIHSAAGYASQNADGTISKVTILWQVFAFVVITFAEILISVTGLELAFTAAPKSMKSFVTALWLLAVGLANLFINTPVSQMYPGKDAGFLPQFKTAGDYFGALTIAMLAVTVVFFFVARRFNKSQIEQPSIERAQRNVSEAE